MTKFDAQSVIHHLRHELKYAWPNLHNTLVLRQRERLLQRWLKSLSRRPPQVLIGANIDENGGIRQHLLGIGKHSRLMVELAPPDWLRNKLSYHDFHTTFRDQFFDFQPSGIGTLHSHVYPYFVEWCATRRDSTRWVHTYHAPYLPEYGRNGLEPWQIEINRTLVDVARNADVRVSVSRWQQAYLKEEHGIETVYIPNGVDVNFCDLGRAERFRRRSGLRDFILYVGRNDPVKNPADFVRLAQSLPNSEFLMVGPNLDADTLLADWHVETSRNLHFTGALSRLEVQDAIAACTAVVVTSRREGLPTIVLEALAHRKPVVVPDDAGCLEAIGGGAFGLVYQHGDLADLAVKTQDALSERRNSSAARDRVLSEFDWRVVAPQLDDIYRS
jgi:glycosyltransferase involved in cell wall biosynthesis